MLPATASSHQSDRNRRPADANAGGGSPQRDEGTRRYPIGAELVPSGGVHFRVWGPAARTVAVELLDASQRVVETVALTPEPNGYFSGFVAQARAGTLYRYRLPGGAFPDPASRFQPDGPHGPSQVVDPTHTWTDTAWPGRPRTEMVLYELHLGTFTAEGTWRAAMAELPELARIGITAVEIMPVADFAGGFGWGYDGVDLFAPSRLYGSPSDARAFVDRAHALGLMVILDVVYNHLGPDGCYLQEYSRDYFTTKYECEWGQPLNFDGENAAPVREFFVTNARYWTEEFHCDGLRLDATQQIFDASPTHIVAEITAAAHMAARQRQAFVVAENEPQQARLLRDAKQGGFGLDAVWNDDFHHAATVAAAGRAEAYYSDYRGAPQEFISAYKRGYLFQGQWCRWQKKRRGTPALDLSPARFVVFLQNHDQVANSLRGQRLHQLTSPAMYRALSALQLLGPSIPLLFQGQEFAASTPFLYFADHKPELAGLIAQGRRTFLQQFRSVKAAENDVPLASPGDARTFQACKLDLGERQRHADVYRLYTDLLHLRREQPVFRTPAAIDGAVLGEHAFVLRYFGGDGDDRLLIVNLGADVYFNPAPEPLLAPCADQGWQTAWSSESPRYGGGGTPALETTENWIIPGPAAYVLSPHSNRELPGAKVSEKD